MQTFLPYPSFERSAKSIDNLRLGNQTYRECKTLINGGWKNHPASKMWVGHERALAKYAYALACEMAHRKNKNGGPKWKPEVVEKWKNFWLDKMEEYPDTGDPHWMGDEKFHVAHQSNLIRKDPEHYGPQFPGVPDNLEYVWP